MNTNLQDFVEKVAAFIEQKLEERDTDVNFEIIPQIGDYQYQPQQGRIRRPNKPKVTGTLISRQSDLVPIEGYDLFTLNSLLSIITPADMVPEVYDAVSKFVVYYTGRPTDMGGAVNNVWIPFWVQYNFSTPIINDRQQRQGAGDSAVIQLFISCVAYGSAVLGNKIKLAVDAEEMKVLQAAFQCVKSYDADNIGNGEYVQNPPTSQSLTLTVKIAYRDTTKIKEIVQDILTGTLEKTYNITYRDGVTFTSAANQFSATMTLGTGTVNFAPGTVASVDLVFYKR